MACQLPPRKNPGRAAHPLSLRNGGSSQGSLMISSRHRERRDRNWVDLRLRQRESAKFDRTRAPARLLGFRLAAGANADEIEPMPLYSETSDAARLPDDHLQTRF